MKHNVFCRLLFIISSVVLCGHRCDGRKSVIPTVVRKSANTEGLVCLLVSRGVGPLHLVNSNSFPAKKFQRRNSRRGIPHPSKSLANLETPHESAAAVSREFESNENQHLDGVYTGDGQFQASHIGNQREIRSSHVSGEFKGSNFEVLERRSDGFHNNLTETLTGVPVESTGDASEKSVPDLLSSQQHFQGGPIIQEDRLYHFPSEPASLNSREVHIESPPSLTPQNDTQRQNLSSSNGTLLTEALSVPSRHDMNERSTKNRQFPLLRPIKPESSRKVVQRNKPLVKVSLMVKATSGNVQFDGGEVVVDDRFLEEGMHTLEFAHVVEEDEHRLRVYLDGHEGQFVGSTRPRRPPDFQFHEVWIKIQGPVTFIGNNSCESEQSDGAPETSATPKDPLFFADDDGDKKEDDEVPGEDKAQDNPSPPTANVYPLKAIINEVVNNRSMTHKIVINSTVSDSSLSLSYINNSTLINTSVDNSIVINAKVINSTFVNSTLQNVHLVNCEVINSRTINSETENTKIFNLLPFNSTRYFGFDPLHDQITFEDFDETPPFINANFNGVDITMMVFGVLGLIVLVLVMVGVVLLITRHIIKKRREMLLVRSAVMGSVKSW